MTRFFRWGVLATALMMLATAGVQAQQPQSLPATKVGLVNMGLMFTKYKKAEFLKKELESELAPLKLEAEKTKSIIEQHMKYLEKFGDKDPTQAEISRKTIKDGQRLLQDLDEKARRQIGKKQEAQLVMLYKEIHAAVQMYAQQTGYHVIFAYGDPPDVDLMTPQNIGRKMTGMDTGAGVPFYVAPGLDISQDVLARLNAAYQGGGLPGGGVPAIPAGFQQPRQN